MSKRNDPTRSPEAKQETLRRRQERTNRQAQAAHTNRAIRLMTTGY